MQLDIWLQPQQATPSPLPLQLVMHNDNSFGYDERHLTSQILKLNFKFSAAFATATADF